MFICIHTHTYNTDHDNTDNTILLIITTMLMMIKQRYLARTAADKGGPSKGGFLNNRLFS